MRLLTIVSALALLLAPVAHSANVATPKMEQVASWAAGKPVSVWCENDPEAWTRMLATVGIANQAGFAYVGGERVYVGPSACAGLLRPAGEALGPGLNILLHEATHARGWRDEALTECAARVLIYSALHDFYGVPWYSPLMRVTTEAALSYSLTKAPEYQNGCSRL